MTEFSRYTSTTQRVRNAVSGRRRVLPSDPADAIRDAVLADPYLRDAYSEMYSALARLLPDGVPGAVVEIGAGSGVAREWIPGIVCTDIVAADGLDCVADATRLPFRDGSVRALVLKDAWHHIPDLPAFLDESMRCLAPGGAVLVCDPYWGPMASFIYRFLHPEPFDRRQADWRFDAEDEWDSNQALLWIALRRDRPRLARRWPGFRVEEHGALLGPSYALSGGVFGRTPVPSTWLSAVWRRERHAGRWLDPLRLEYVVRLVKRPVG